MIRMTRKCGKSNGLSNWHWNWSNIFFKKTYPIVLLVWVEPENLNMPHTLKVFQVMARYNLIIAKCKYFFYSPKRAPKANPAINDGMEPLMNEWVLQHKINATSGCITNSLISLTSFEISINSTCCNDCSHNISQYIVLHFKQTEQAYKNKKSN